MLGHIGERIKEVFYEKRLRAGEFAEGINKSRNVVYNIFKGRTIDTGLLHKIGEVLEHDFFQYYRSGDNLLLEEQSSYLTKNNLLEKITELEDDLEKCKSKLEQSQKEATYLKKINELLESKKG